MSMQKKLVLFAVLCGSFSIIQSNVQKKSFKENSCQFELKTTAYAKHALIAAIQSLDHLLYPALCVGAGRSVYNQYLQQFTPETPAAVATLENAIPGGNTARHLATYLAVGSALLITLHTLTDLQTVSDFMQVNMPHSAQLISYFKEQFSQKNAVNSSLNGYIVRSKK